MHYLGIDVSKATLDVSDASGDSRLSSANSRAGVRKLIKWAQDKHEDKLQFVIEPTSTYHHVLLDELSNSDIAFTVINPARTKAYSNSLGKRAKTDRVDAQLLASLGQTQQIAPSHQPERSQEQIKSLRRHRESIEQQIRSLRNQIGSVTCSPWADPEVLRSLRSTIRHLEKQTVSADRRLEQLIDEDETYSTTSSLLQTIPGIGPKTAQLLISEMPPAWQCSTSRAWVAFAGVCPQPFQSGHFKLLPPIPHGQQAGEVRDVHRCSGLDQEQPRNRRTCREAQGTWEEWKAGRDGRNEQTDPDLLRGDQVSQTIRPNTQCCPTKHLISKTASEPVERDSGSLSLPGVRGSLDRLRTGEAINRCSGRITRLSDGTGLPIHALSSRGVRRRGNRCQRVTTRRIG